MSRAALARATCVDVTAVVAVCAASGPCSVRQVGELCRVAVVCVPSLGLVPSRSALREAVDGGTIASWRHGPESHSWDVVEVPPELLPEANVLPDHLGAALALVAGLLRAPFDAVVELATTDAAYRACLLEEPARTVANTVPGF